MALLALTESQVNNFYQIVEDGCGNSISEDDVFKLRLEKLHAGDDDQSEIILKIRYILLQIL